MIQLVLQLTLTVILAFIIGKMVSKLKLPSILGWLITGMISGPYALSLINGNIMDAKWYQVTIHILECTVGLMIGTELVWKRLKKYGKSIIIITLTQSLGTFLLVSFMFGIIFYFWGIPMYLAFILGGIALATAPAPALSIVQEFNTNGPVTRTLIPMAALDDIVGCIVFFTTTALVAGNLSAGKLPVYMIALVVLLPLLFGVATGVITGIILKRTINRRIALIFLLLSILFTSFIGLLFNNYLLSNPLLNFLLLGMAFSATFTNMINEEQLQQLKIDFTPFLTVAMVVVIFNLGAPLDYHSILGTGIFTVIYIVSRALGKYFGAYFGASITHAPQTVKKYLGLTLLPHSGVSLVFTGIAVSILNSADPISSRIVQGIIAAAAIINEVIAVIIAKKGFEWAGEF
ncbi:cation:proton antiporter [Bacteroides eggerthii]|uniref:cation:proton antiporter n=1 Tax=Bacteroides eggerthii TaxID=28111 RepID=UPI003562D4CA